MVITMKGLMTIGIATLLLVVRRFFELPFGANHVVWNAAIGALAIGIGYAVFELGPDTKEQRFRLVFAGVCLNCISWLSGSSPFPVEDIAQHAGVALIVAALLVGRSWKPIVGFAVASIVGKWLLVSFPMSLSDPWPWVWAVLFGLLLPRWRAWWGVFVAMLALGIGWWQLTNIGAMYMSNEQLAAFTATFDGLMVGLGILMATLIRALPSWKPLAHIGVHSVSIYLVTFLLAWAFGVPVSFDFGWTMYSPLSGNLHAPAFDGAMANLASFAVWPNLWAGLAALVLCLVAALRTKPGPVEQLFEWTYRRV